ncbi:MAG: ExbD/TolR family protein [Shewanella sp.]
MICSKKSLDEEGLSPDLTSLMDIIFIVMVFLLLSANIQVQTLTVSIPKAQSSSELGSADNSALAVTVTADDERWGLQDKVFSDWDTFTAAFTVAVKHTPNRPVIIASDKQANVEKLLKLFEFMQQHQIHATHIMMKGPNQ